MCLFLGGHSQKLFHREDSVVAKDNHTATNTHTHSKKLFFFVCVVGWVKQLSLLLWGVYQLSVESNIIRGAMETAMSSWNSSLHA